MPEHVVVQVGNNGPVYPEDMLAIRAELEGVPTSTWSTSRCRAPGRARSTRSSKTRSATWPEARCSTGTGRSPKAGSDLTFDGIHPNPEGDVVYVDLIVEAVLAEEAEAAAAETETAE